MRAREFIFESTNIASAEQVWDYVDTIHPIDQQGGGFLKSLIMKYPQYELRRIPLSDIHIPDQEYDDEEQEDEHNDPYNRAMFVDPEHAGEYSQHYVDRNPIVIDAEGHILDGAHRAWAAAELLNKSDIMAWVPAKKLTESQSVKQEIKDFIDSLTPADVGVEEFSGYRVHFEGFTDDCKLSSDYQRNPNKVYQQVYQDFVQREGGKKPAKSGMTGDEEYPILYSVFRVPQSKTVDTAERAYSIAYRKKQPWPRDSREEQLIRSDWQLSGLYDQYVLKQGVAEGIMNIKDIISEIEPLPANTFFGGAGELRSGAVSKIPKLKPIPGMNSKFSFVIRPRPTNNNDRTIDIYSKERGYFKHIAELQLLRCDDYYPFKGAYMVATITTHEDYRGQGFASKLYELYFRYVGKILLSGQSQTPGGQRNWVSMFKSPNLTVDGLIGIPDYFFDADYPKDKLNPNHEKYIADIMKMGGEWVGDSPGGRGVHWLRVPIRRDKNRLEVLYKTSRVSMYNDQSRSLLMATWSGK